MTHHPLKTYSDLVMWHNFGKKKFGHSEIKGILEQAVVSSMGRMVKLSNNGIIGRLVKRVMGGEGKLSDNGVTQEYQDISASVDCAVNELVWYKKGKKVLFVENKALVDCILRSNFDADNAITNLSPLGDTFYLVLPKGVIGVDGEEVPNMLVRWSGKGDTDIKRETKDITSSIMQKNGCGDVDIRFQGDQRDAEHSISITCAFDNGEMQTNIIPEAEFADYLMDKGKNIDPAIVSGLKIVLGLAIYVSSGGSLKKGVPTKAAMTERSQALKILEKGTKLSTISFNKDMKNHMKKGGHIRGFHFRNLRHSRYYQNEYSDLPAGSRWVFVKPHWTGGKVDLSTITEKV